MRLCSIASGSSGNCIYVGSDTTHVLIDAGISKKRIIEGLETVGVTGDDLSAIFITHEHIDHIAGVGVMSRGYEKPIYGTKGTIRGIRESKSIGKMPEGIFHEIIVDEVINIGDLKIEAFRISHDAMEPSGYKIYHEGKCVAVATDLGIYDEYTVNKLCKLDAIVIEANHDIHMVEVGAYPYSLKQRVLGNKGHLSNELSGRLLCDILHDKLKFVVLGHLSKDNNYAELAYETVKLEINMSKVPFTCEDFQLIVANRDTPSQIIQV